MTKQIRSLSLVNNSLFHKYLEVNSERDAYGEKTLRKMKILTMPIDSSHKQTPHRGPFWKVPCPIPLK